MRRKYAVLIEWNPNAPANIKLIRKDSKEYKQFLKNRIKSFYREMHGKEMPAGFPLRKWYKECERNKYFL